MPIVSSRRVVGASGTAFQEDRLTDAVFAEGIAVFLDFGSVLVGECDELFLFLGRQGGGRPDALECPVPEGC